MDDPGVRTGADGVTRCWWCGDDPLLVAYHDHEWGRPVTDDVRLFEKLCLEGFQAGLSWLTILRKREAFRAAFAGFDFRVLAGWGDDAVDRLVTDAAIVRHRGKIASVLHNARRAVALVDEAGSLHAHVAAYATSRPRPRTRAEIPAVTPASVALSRDLRRRGWTYVGPTTAYAFLQAMGLVDDHLAGCDITW